MKFAFLVGGELRAVNKTIKKLYKNIIDYYDADIILLCQREFEDDEERVGLFDRKVRYKRLYDKPNPIDYFGPDSNIEYVIKDGKHIRNADNIAWRYPDMLQIIINMNEMAKVVKDFYSEYDYYIFLRTDVNILFPFPDKEHFEKIPKSVYAFNCKYSQYWGGQGMANFIHKDYIIDLLTACYDYVINPKVDKYLINNPVNIYELIPNYYNGLTDIDSQKINDLQKEKIGINQEQFFILATQNKKIRINNIVHTNFYYTVDSKCNRTSSGKIMQHLKYNVLCKYEKQVNEAYENFTLWNNNYRWGILENTFILKI